MMLDGESVLVVDNTMFIRLGPEMPFIAQWFSKVKASGYRCSIKSFLRESNTSKVVFTHLTSRIAGIRGVSFAMWP